MVNPTTVSSHRNVLGLFAKAWDPGKVKTRLAKTLGYEVAASIYLELLALHLIRFAESADDRAVVYAPADESTESRFSNLIDSMHLHSVWKLTPQVQLDLGGRMSTFFQQQFDASNGQARVVVVGTDAPRLTPEIINDAFEALKTHEVVFGPSNDGGYYLVGQSVMTEDIFTDIPWSTEDVYPMSLERCHQAGLSIAELQALTDIDEESDLLQEISALENLDDPLVRTFVDRSMLLLRKGNS